MPSLSEHKSTALTKLLLIGDSGTGKTGALTSLVEAGYDLRILDFDNGLDSLVWQVRDRCPTRLSSINYQTFRDKMKSSPAGPVLDGMPSAFVNAVKSLDNWPDGLGKPSTWGDKVILVVDSLTFMSNSALNWAEMFKPSKDRRQIFGEAQKAVESVIAMLTAEEFQTNVIVISHVAYQERDDGTKKGYPTTVGAALSPKIPAYFNSVALCETTPKGRTIRTQATSMIDLKNPASFKMAQTFPIESGLAAFFKTVRGE